MRVGRAQQPPAIRIGHPYAVDIVDVDVGVGHGGEPVTSLVDDGELSNLRHVDPDLRRIDDLRQGIAQRRQGFPRRRDGVEQPDGGIDAIVETVPAVGEENMAAHLAGQRRVHLRHSCLDDRVAGGRHHRRAAQPFDFIEQHLARLYVGQDRRTRIARQQVGRKNCQDLVAPDHATLAVDRAQAVAVAVETEADIGAMLLYGRFQLLEIGLDRRVGMMGGKCSVDGFIQQDMPARQVAHDRLHDLAGGPVTGIPCDGKRLVGAVAGQQSCRIGPHDVGLDHPAFAGGPVARCGVFAQRLDISAP